MKYAILRVVAIAAALSFGAAQAQVAQLSTYPLDRDSRPTQPTYVVNVNADGTPTTTTTGGTAVQGNVAAGVADSGNPVKIGCPYNSTLPTYTNGQRGDCQLSQSGGILISGRAVTVTDATGTASLVSIPNQLGGAGMIPGVTSVFNGTTYDRQRDATIVNATTGMGLSAAGVLCKYNTTPPTYTDGQFGNCQMGTRGGVSFTEYAKDTTTALTSVALATVGTGTDVKAIHLVPNSSANAGVAPSKNAVVGGNRVLKASAGNLYSLNVVSGALAGYILVHDSTTVPADGVVTPIYCTTLAANSSLFTSFMPPITATTGLAVVFSTTGCYSQTTSATAFIAGQVK